MLPAMPAASTPVSDAQSCGLASNTSAPLAE